jgi:hypothetical protein
MSRLTAEKTFVFEIVDAIGQGAEPKSRDEAETAEAGNEAGKVIGKMGVGVSVIPNGFPIPALVVLILLRFGEGDEL